MCGKKNKVSLSVGEVSCLSVLFFGDFEGYLAGGAGPAGRTSGTYGIVNHPLHGN